VGDHVLKEQFGDSMDNAILVLRTHITEKLGFDPRGHTEAAVFRLCLEHAFNPVLDYLDSLKWDGKPRLDTWLMTYLGATEGALNRVFGRKVLIAAARRARIPGIKFDQMMVLEGKQDTGKSSAYPHSRRPKGPNK
jgi:predicted P-loop ATPase